MIDIFKHGCRFYKFRCDNCGCEFGTDNVSIAVSKNSFRFSHAGAECPECKAACVCFEENQPPKCCIRKPDTVCPFCSGKEVSFGSSQLTVKKEEGLAVVYDDEGVAANFKWKFCPECGKKLTEAK